MRNLQILGIADTKQISSDLSWEIHYTILNAKGQIAINNVI